MTRATTPTPLQRALAEARRGLLVIAGFSLFLNVLVLVSPIYMFQVYDRVLVSGRVETLVALTVFAVFALLIMGALETLRSRALVRISTWLDRALAGTLIAASVKESLAGQAIGAQALRDLAQLRIFVNSQGICPIFDSPWTPIFIAVIWLLHPWLGILALASAVVLFALALGNELVTRRPLQEANQISVAALRHSDAALRNAEVVQAMGMLPAVLRRWDAENERVLERQTVASDRAGTIMGLTKALRLMVQVAILGLGAYLVLQGELTGGGMIAGSILLGRALAPVEQAIGAWKSFIAARSSYDRLQALLQRHPERLPVVHLPRPEGRVTLDRAVFTPPGGTRPILKQLSFEVAPGEVLAVVGPSASGKSTLCRLIVGVWPPSAGHVRLDGADVHAWERADFGCHIGYLPQDVELFAGTILGNIARMGQASDEAVIEAAQLAGVHEMILELPDAYATEIGPGGAVLSGGQRQRIGLARAMFGEPRLVVLDEPSASLDNAGDAALLEAIGNLKRHGTTVILVAHRPSLISQVDKILVLRDGAVELFGPRDQILPRITAPRPAPQIQQAASLAGGG